MNNAFRRLALLASVSLPSLGSAAHAASTAQAGVEQFSAANSVNETLTICDIGSDCEFGVTVTGTSLAHALLVETALGQINQTGIGLGSTANVVLDLRNSGQADFAAIASAQGTSIASAIAIAATPISQLGQANGGVALDFANDGSISIAASAHAQGRTALAQGLVDGAIHQQAISIGTGDVRFGFSNSGDISVDALAAASGEANAIATAVVTNALAMRGVAVAGDAAATGTNSGSISIDAHALAIAGGDGTASHATTAVAVVSHGIVEHADAGYEASASFENEGSIAIQASAEVSGPGGIVATRSGFTFADGPTAFALITAGFDQGAQSFGGGDALAGFVNNGILDIGSIAHAHSSGIGNALAVALDFNGIAQSAIAWGLDDAAVSLSNAGTLAVSVSASAVADDVRGRASGIAASASGQIVNGIGQGGFANGDASAQLDNSGTISVSGLAHASAEDAFAHANMIVAGAIVQVAQGGSQTATTSFGAPGNATADLDNSGLIRLDFGAIAEGQRALVDAFVATGIAQAASAGGSALAQFSNAGGIEIKALGDAFAAGGTATAAGGVLIGIDQHVRGSALADASFSNDGSIMIGAGAEAISTAPSSRSDGGFALAIARLGGVTFVSAHGALTQNAIADVVDLSLDNSGTIDLGAAANASGNGARGAASIVEGIRQVGRSRNGDAVAGILNDGEIDMSVVGLADGHAGAATAIADVGNAIEQNVFAANGNARAAFTNAGSFDLSAAASAQGDDRVEAFAVARGLTQRVAAFGSTSNGATATDLIGQAEFHNSGSFAVSVSALAHGALGSVFGFNPAASAFAAALAASQQANFALFENEGLLSVEAHAFADASADAFAQVAARGVEQLASAFAPVVQLSATNSGTIALGGSAIASGSTGAIAMAQASHGLNQQGLGVSVSESIANSGVVGLAATASAVAASGVANALADAAAGLGQIATGSDIDQAIANAGSATIAANAAVSAQQTAFAIATGGGGARQAGNGSTIRQDIQNSGSIAFSVHAEAIANPMAFAGANSDQRVPSSAVQQFAFGSDIAQSISNSGTLAAFAEASAIAHGSAVTTRAGGEILSGQAAASAVAVGIGQVAFGRSISQEIDNRESIAAEAHALAQLAVDASSGVDVRGSAAAVARAVGAEQSAAATSAFDQSLTNSGTIAVLALATAEGAGGNATASALGGNIASGGQIPLTVSVVNSGAINVGAGATSPGRALSVARGIAVVNQSSLATEPLAFDLAGTIENSGEINVMARVDGHSVPNSRSSAFNGGSALAEGISVAGGANALTIANSGAISVDAVATEGNRALAVGISATANGATTSRSPGVLTITNDGGSIIVRQSNDGGESWHRGLAIDVSGEPGRNAGPVPNATVVNLRGDGEIYGDFALNAGDQINVANGTTYFDGVILPDSPSFGEIVLFHGLGGGGGSLAASAAPSGIIDLNIQEHGNLILADAKFTGNPSMYDGPAYAFVDTLNVAAGGTLSFELQPQVAGAQDPGSYPQVFANTANLDGTLALLLTTSNGLFADSYSWNDLIDANVTNGAFDQCELGGALAGSLLFRVTCTYDSDANVDVTVDRKTFDQVAGLGRNSKSVAERLEGAYSTALSGGLGDVVGDLFLIADPTKYDKALNQVSGAVYANYLQSFVSLGVHYNDILDSATKCDATLVRTSVLECRGPNPLRVWGKADYQKRTADGDSEAGSARSRRFSGVVGLDTSVGDAGIIGGSIGYVTNHVRDFQFGDQATAKGQQVGAYGVYDPGNFFVRAMTNYSWYDGKSVRNIDFGQLAQGASFAARSKGDPDVNMWTFGLHGGARVNLGGRSILTPYLNYDYVHTKLKGFTETDGEGAELKVAGGLSNHSYLTGGMTWAAEMGSVVPELGLGYRYLTGNSRSRFTGTLLEDPSGGFEIISASQRRGTALANLSVGGKVGRLDLRIAYEGEFNGDVTSHGGNFKLVLPLGGHSATPDAHADRAP